MASAAGGSGSGGSGCRAQAAEIAKKCPNINPGIKGHAS